MRWERLIVVTTINLGFQVGTSGKENTCQSRRHKRCGFDPWVGELPGGGHGNTAQYSCLENPINRGAWWAILSMGSQRVRHD